MTPCVNFLSFDVSVSMLSDLHRENAGLCCLSRLLVDCAKTGSWRISVTVSLRCHWCPRCHRKLSLLNITMQRYKFYIIKSIYASCGGALSCRAEGTELRLHSMTRFKGNIQHWYNGNVQSFQP